jgi:transcription antitermination factor NusG
VAISGLHVCRDRASMARCTLVPRHRGAHSDGDRPAKVPDKVIDDLKSRERNGLIVLPPPPHLQRGDQVRILRGPFAGHLAIYDGMRPRERVVVLLTLLGAVQRVELAKRDVVVAPR